MEDADYSYASTDIDNVSDQLGIPWEMSKDVPFGFSVPFVSFLWDLPRQFLSLVRKKLNILWLLSNGKHGAPTSSQKYKSFMASCFTPHSSFQKDVHTSQAWRPCSESFTEVHSCHVPHPAILQAICYGGKRSSSDQSYPDQSQPHANLSISKPSQMQAQKLVSGLQSATSGRHGDSCPVGKEMEGTSGGQRLLASSSLSKPSSHPMIGAFTTRFSETTAVLLRDGGKAGAKTDPLMMYSDESTTSRLLLNALSTCNMYQASSTRPTTPLGVFTQTPISSSPKYPYRKNLRNSSSTLMPANAYVRSAFVSRVHSPYHRQSRHGMAMMRTQSVACLSLISSPTKMLPQDDSQNLRPILPGSHQPHQSTAHTASRETTSDSGNPQVPAIRSMLRANQ
jgi:hypothetical protein